MKKRLFRKLTVMIFQQLVPPLVCMAKLSLIRTGALFIHSSLFVGKLGLHRFENRKGVEAFLRRIVLLSVIHLIDLIKAW